MDSVFLQSNRVFTLFGIDHLGAIIAAFVFGFFLIRYSKNKLSPNQQNKVFNAISISMLIVLITSLVIEHFYGNIDPKEDLPFVICYFSVLLSPIFTFTRSKLMYDVLLFWVMLFTLQAVITPDLYETFPHFRYLKFWYLHAGLIIMMFYATVIYDYRPTLKSIFYSWVGAQLYMLLMAGINLATNSNYFYLMHPPENPSVLDALGPWPWYIVWGQVIAIPYFFLVYGVFKLVERKKVRA